MSFIYEEPEQRHTSAWFQAQPEKAHHADHQRCRDTTNSRQRDLAWEHLDCWNNCMHHEILPHQWTGASEKFWNRLNWFEIWMFFCVFLILATLRSLNIAVSQSPWKIETCLGKLMMCTVCHLQYWALRVKKQTRFLTTYMWSKAQSTRQCSLANPNLTKLITSNKCLKTWVSLLNLALSQVPPDRGRHLQCVACQKKTTIG